MAIQSVDITALPVRHREISADDKALAEAVVKAASANGKGASDGEPRDKKAATSYVSRVKRLLNTLGLVPDGMEPKTRITETKPGSGLFTWTLYFGPKPETPRTRKPRTRKAAA